MSGNKDDLYDPNAWGQMRSYLAIQGFKQAWIDANTDENLTRGENAQQLAEAMHDTPKGDEVGINLIGAADATVISWTLQNALTSLDAFDGYWCLALASDGPRTMGKVLVSVTPGADYRFEVMGHDDNVPGGVTIDVYDGDRTGWVAQQGDILHVGSPGSEDWQDLDVVITAQSALMTVGLGSISPNTGRFVLARLTAA